MNIGRWDFEHSRRFGAHVGLVINGRAFTNGELHEQALRLASVLVEQGLDPGDRVAIALPNCVELFITCSATWIAGGVVVVLGDAPHVDIAPRLAHCGAALLVRRLEHASVLGGRSLDSELVVVERMRDRSVIPLAELKNERHTLRDAVARHAEAPAQLCYTSGTTGTPRAVVYTHGSIDAFWRAHVTRRAATTPNPVLLLAVPPTAFGAMLLGARLTEDIRYVVMERLDPEGAFESIERHRVTELPLLPTMAEQLLACVTRRNYDVSSLEFINLSGAHVRAALVSQLRERFASPSTTLERERAEPSRPRSPTVLVLYGMTELGGSCAATANGGDGMVGTVLPGAEVRIVDNEGNAVEPGRQGEIIARTPYMPTAYWNDPEATARIFRDGFVRTGDLGRFSGRELSVLGRIKEIIIQGGQNIHPEEIAAVVRSVEGVVECAVVGVADELLGEAAVALVVARADNSNVTERAIHDHCRRRLSAAKRPAHVLRVDAVPYNEAGKLDLAALRQLAEAALRSTCDAALVARLDAADRPARIELLEGIVETLLRAISPDSGSDSPNPADRCTPFGERGLDSLGTVRLAHALSGRLGRTISPILLFARPTVVELSEDIADRWTRSESGERSGAAGPTAAGDDAVAIVGIGCRLPAGARSATEYWTLMLNGVDTVKPAPTFRWPKEATPWQAAFLDDVDCFDARFFGLAAEAAELDPRHRVFLEVAWEALEDAGLHPHALPPKTSGVFLGIYGERYKSPNALGTAPGMAIARLCHFLDLRGPAVSIDTTCSSSLVAVHHAVESLCRGECDLAIAGGVNLLAAPLPETSGIASADGRSKAFDAAADGFGQGEGCVLVVLKRVQKALAEGDRIYALIRGSAINHDGRGNSLTAPNPRAQTEVIRSALRRARLNPDDVQYVEAHGTGTPLGDPIEIDGLARAFGRKKDRELVIGSVKTNLGHLEAAAGAAGLVKVALAIFHRRLPKSLHFVVPNPHVPWNEVGIRVQSALGPWPRHDAPLIGSVSAFGLSGTNAHAVLTEAPTSMARVKGTAGADVPLLLPLSASSTESLRARSAALAAFLETDEADVNASDIAYTASCRRGHLAHRLAVVGASRAEWAAGLRTFLECSERPETPVSEPPRVAFVFNGQGSQWWGMAQALLREEPAFRSAIERCAEGIERHVPWRLLEELESAEGSSRMTRTEIAQPALFALQVALYELWRSWGVEPTAVSGHSLGEIAAAHVAGALSLDDASRLVCERGRLMQRIAGKGRMLYVAMPVAAVEDFAAPLAGSLDVAADNGPSSCTLSGELQVLNRMLEILISRGIAAKVLAVDCAFHSRQIEPLQQELAAAISGIAPRAPRIPMISTLDSATPPALDAGYWTRQARDRVDFHGATKALVKKGCSVFIEIGPHSVLVPEIQATARSMGSNVATISSQRRETPGRRGMLDALARLYRVGYAVDWSRQYDGQHRVVSLPPYAWCHRRYWHESAAAQHRSDPTPLVRRHRSRSEDRSIHRHSYEVRLDLTDPRCAYLAGHRFLGDIWFPASGFLELARQAAADAYAVPIVRLEQVAFENALVLTPSRPRTLEILLDGDGDQRRFEISCRDEQSPQLVRLSSGFVRLIAPSSTPRRVALAAIRERCTEPIAVAELMSEFGAGFTFGDDFTGIEDVWSGKGEALAKLRCSERVELEREQYGVHPAMLDAALRVGGAALERSGMRLVQDRRPALPSRIAAFTVTVPGAHTSSTYVRASRRDAGERVDVLMCDEEGRVIAEAEGFEAKHVDLDITAERCLRRIEWRPVAAPTRRVAGRWLIYKGRSGIGSAVCVELESRGIRVCSAEPSSEYVRRHVDQFEICMTQAEHVRRLLADIAETGELAGIAYLPGADFVHADATALPDFDGMNRHGLLPALQLVKAVSDAPWRTVPPRLVIITRGAQALGGDAPGFLQAALWGFGASVSREHPEWDVRLIDIDPGENCIGPLCDELGADDEHPKVVVRRSQRLVPVVVRHRPTTFARAAKALNVGESGYEATLRRIGSLDSIGLREVPRSKPGPGEMEVRVRATALNFRDALIALGRYPGAHPLAPMGGECAGVVEQVGQGVEGYSVGDEVVALGGGLLRAFATVRSSHVRHKPARLTFSEAASMTVVFATALFALGHVARVRAGERVLIHAAAGGVGLAALQYCRHVGAEVIATAGSERKREFLRSLGVEHVFGSRDLAWVDAVRNVTAGRGVDVVLNSLSGDALHRGLDVLSPGGRFVELGKQDIYAGTQVSLAAFRHNAAFVAASLDELPFETLRALYDEVWRWIEAGTFQPLPVEEIGIAELQTAMQRLAAAKQVGKIVVMAKESVTTSESGANPVRADRSYLVTGGFGALGLVAATRLVRCGARHLILVARHAPSEAADRTIEALRNLGATVRAAVADVSERDALVALLDEASRTMPPLAGIIHCAGVIRDGTLPNVSDESFADVMAAKATGAWHLHSLTTNLDFFVMFSSTAGFFGSAGQSNYAAANALLDAFAHYRRHRGLPAQSISWGGWRVGMAAKLNTNPAETFDAGHGGDIFERLLHDREPHVLAFKDADAARAQPPAKGTGRVDLATARFNATAGERTSTLADDLRRWLADLADLAPEDVSPSHSLSALGIDSLAVIRLRARIMERLNVPVPPSALGPQTTMTDMLRQWS